MSHSSQINFSKYVALGDSITAGYTNGALYNDGQKINFAKLLSQQFQKINKGIFNQPLVDEDSIGVGFYGNAKIVLNDINNFQTPHYAAAHGDFSIFVKNNFAEFGPFHNMGIPSAKLTSLVIDGVGNPENGIGFYNPFFTRMASNPVSASVLSDTIKLNSTFFTLFIGSNDVLTYASSGCVSDFITPTDGEVGIGFEKTLEHIVTSLNKNNTYGAIANIADITTVPYFTVVPWDSMILTIEEASELNKKHTQFNFKEGRNALLICDSATDVNSIRQLKKDELIILDIQLDDDKKLYFKGLKAVPKKYNLVETEILNIKQAVISYNEIIKKMAQHFHLAFIDVNSFTKTLTTEIRFNPKHLCAEYTNEAVFSLDGLHLNDYGHARLANFFIEKINFYFNVLVEEINVNEFKK